MSERNPYGRKDAGSRAKDDESTKSESETESASSAWSEREEERYKAKKGHSPTEPKSRESPTSKPKSPESPTSKPKSPESPTSKPKSRESPTSKPKSPESPTSKPKSPESPTGKPKSRESPTSEPKSRESPTTELKSRESPTSRGTVRRAADRSAGRMEVNGTGRKIDDFSSDEDENGDKKTTVLSMEAVDAEEVKSPKRSSRSSKSSSSSSSSSADSSDEREKEEQKKPVVVSMQRFSDEELASEKAAAEKENREKRRQKEAEESQQQRKREIEELRKAEEERRQREKSEERKREEERRQREEEKRAEAQREAERKTEERRREEAAQRRPDSVTSADEQSREEARLKAQQLREAEILEGQRQREERRRVEERERVEAWRRQQAQREEEIRNVENRREERRQEEGVSSARSTPTSSSFAKSFSLASESDTDHSQKHAAREKVATQGQHKELDKSIVSPPKELDSPASAKKMSGEEKSPKGKPVTPVNYLESEDQPSTAPASSRTVESGRSSRSSATSDSSSGSSSDSDSDGDSGSDNEGIVDKSSKTTSELKQTAAESQAEDKKLAAQVEGKETKISAEVYAAPVLWSPKLDKAKEEISDSSSSDGESPSGRSSSRISGHNDTAKTPISPERAAHVRMPLLTADGVVNSRSRLTDDAVEEGIEGDGPAHVLPEEAELKMDDEAEHRLRPPSAMVEQQPSSFSSLDEEIWKSEQGRGGKQQTSDSDDEFVINGDRPGLHAERETSREESLEMTDDRPEATSPESSWRERLVGEDTVELPNVSLTKTQVQELASHLEVAEKVTLLDLRNTGLNDEDLQKVTEAIAASLSEVEMLNLSLNSLTEESVPHLLRVLKAKPSVKLLLLHGNRLGDVGVGQLVAGLQSLHREARTQRMTKASEPSADSVSLDSTASSIAQSNLPSRYILRDLDLAGTGIGDEGAERIGELLGGNVYVEALRLSSNEGVTAEGGWARIGEGIAKNRCLKSLALDGNRIGDVGVKHLARGLFKNHALTSLKLQNAGIGEDGAKAIMEMLKRNTTLQDLTLTPGNAISEELMNDINNYVALNRASGTALPRR